MQFVCGLKLITQFFHNAILFFFSRLMFEQLNVVTECRWLTLTARCKFDICTAVNHNTACWFISSVMWNGKVVIVVGKGSLLFCVIISVYLYCWVSRLSLSLLLLLNSPLPSLLPSIPLFMHSSPSSLHSLLHPDDEQLGLRPAWPHSDQWETVCEWLRLPSCSLSSYECAETPEFEVCNIWSMGNPFAQWCQWTMWPQFCLSLEGHCRLQILWPVLDTSLRWEWTTPIWNYRFGRATWAR